MSTSPISPPVRVWLWLPLLAMGCVMICVFWVVVALRSQLACGWMAPLVAIEAVWMLHLGTMRAGWGRALLAVVATVLVTCLSCWVIAAAHVGLPMGFSLSDSIFRMGPNYAWTLTSLASTTMDWLWVASALLIALFGGWWGKK